MNSADHQFKDELTDLCEAVSRAADAESLQRAIDRLTEYLTRQNEEQHGEAKKTDPMKD
jgi:hypothetical protein